MTFIRMLGFEFFLVVAFVFGGGCYGGKKLVGLC